MNQVFYALNKPETNMANGAKLTFFGHLRPLVQAIYSVYPLSNPYCKPQFVYMRIGSGSWFPGARPCFGPRFAKVACWRNICCPACGIIERYIQNALMDAFLKSEFPLRSRPPNCWYAGGRKYRIWQK